MRNEEFRPPTLFQFRISDFGFRIFILSSRKPTDHTDIPDEFLGLNLGQSGASVGRLWWMGKAVQPYSRIAVLHDSYPGSGTIGA